MGGKKSGFRTVEPSIKQIASQPFFFLSPLYFSINDALLLIPAAAASL
jgi:hypothetical protein